MTVIFSYESETVLGKKNAHHVKIYTFSTCGWCKKTKALLKDLDVEYEYVDVDILTGNDYTDANEEVKKYNPYRTYPTIVIDREKRLFLDSKTKRLRRN